MKIHLLLKKEEIDSVQMDDSKITVVFDVLLATSTITACLDYGAECVVPVMDEAEALREAKKFFQEDVSLVGEYDGKTIDGFLDPAPLALKEHVAGKTVVLSTTNGTVAIRKAASAKEVYIASLLNGKAVSKQIVETYDNETIVVVCAGSKNKFCIEDFFGAGYFIHQLVNEYGDYTDLTDSALAAKLFYENVEGKDVLCNSRVGQMLVHYERQDDITFVNQQGLLSVIPRLVDGKTIVAEGHPNRLSL
ncbi:2-phosphosulfolactate phosphatase [Virgibacillus ndiopensis]|uniref:2-phosphosulfolactate phosphatase n=1 Tax=Virgibacillus ndiopensis TaxID=2004408 RepID=UPI001FEAF481|nr:2-phosphosulfolactate phosphatase [Virgibacillus ndiopensis]